MAAPTLVSATQSPNWTTLHGNSQSVTIAGVQAGDWLLAVPMSGSSSGAFSITGTGWTQLKASSGGITALNSWYQQFSSTGSQTVQITDTGTAGKFGFIVYQVRNSNGIGASVLNSVASSTCETSITTTAANSLLICVGDDGNATSGARTWDTVNGSAMTEDLYNFGGAGTYTVLAGHAPDSGSSVGAVTIGTSTPTGMAATVLGVEFLAVGSSSIPTPELMLLGVGS